jgi:uncharacterized membrane protein
VIINVVSYIVALVLFAALDIVWLMLMGNALYRPILGDLLAPAVRIGPALSALGLHWHFTSSILLGW